MPRFTVTCPHCKALLEIDDERQVVAGHVPPEKAKSATSFEDRLQSLAKEKEQAQAKLAEAMRAEKAGAELREEKFKKLLDNAKDEPPTKPIRDIDLD